MSLRGVRWEQLDKEVDGDVAIQDIKKALLAGEKRSGFELIEGRVLYKGGVLILKTSTIIPTLLREYHDTASSGYGGDVKKYLLLAQEWF